LGPPAFPIPPVAVCDILISLAVSDNVVSDVKKYKVNDIHFTVNSLNKVAVKIPIFSYIKLQALMKRHFSYIYKHWTSAQCVEYSLTTATDNGSAYWAKTSAYHVVYYVIKLNLVIGFKHLYMYICHKIMTKTFWCSLSTTTVYSAYFCSIYVCVCVCVAKTVDLLEIAVLPM
jgi:hypothetical protein